MFTNHLDPSVFFLCVPITLIQVFLLSNVSNAFTMFTNVMLTQSRFNICFNVRSVVYANTDVVGDFTFSRSLAFHGIKV